ncbi:hypothetical protein Patl1_00193 [Pistacia atlantica]|uniref:Uncharacterized protein n=1 Tax=Pistacia atlantica TaxID=434234 RepID=A0ACC1C6G8_9ROSI|nr:hypothetical protein Patl1_00193 [Pistacia atlantica]
MTSEQVDFTLAIHSENVEEEEGKKERREAIRVTEGIFRNTVAALLNMQEMRSGSSTYSHYSLPPLSLPDADIIQSFPN